MHVDTNFKEMNEDTSDDTQEIRNFKAFWEQVTAIGFTAEHILGEISDLLDGGGWAGWKDQRPVAAVKRWKYLSGGKMKPKVA